MTTKSDIATESGIESHEIRLHGPDGKIYIYTHTGTLKARPQQELPVDTFPVKHG